MANFLEVTDITPNKPTRVLINVDWIKAIFAVDDKTVIVVGDGFFNPLNNEDQPERYVVSEPYDFVKKMLFHTNGIKITPPPFPPDMEGR